MKKTFYFISLAFFVIIGCSKPTADLSANPDEIEMKSGRTSTPFGVADNNGTAPNLILETALYAPQPLPPAKGGFSYTQFPDYDFRPYLINGETEYNPANYDLMAHFQYTSPVAVQNAVVEFTFHHIKYFVPHVIANNKKWVYTVQNKDNEDSKTIITCTTNLDMGRNPMFCFIMKVDCEKGKSVRDDGKSGYTTFWTDMTVNGVSVKGTIKDKVFDCQ